MLLLFLSLICLSSCTNLRFLEMYAKMEHYIFNLDEEKELGDKEVFYTLTQMNCPKSARFFIRGSYNTNNDHQEELKRELKEKYPENFDKCTFKLLGGGKIRKDTKAKKSFIVNGNSAKFGNSNAKLVAHLLKHNEKLKGTNFIFE